MTGTDVPTRERLRHRWSPDRLYERWPWWPGWRDVVAALVLITATFHLIANDGGRPLRPLLPLLLWCVVALVATYPTLAGTSRWVRLLALAWATGPLIALAFADVRAGWVRPVAAWAIAVPVALATLHLLRRRWGGTVVVAIVGLALSVAWFNGLLVWWGGGTARGEPAWMALSWHNQSGTLMAVLGVGGLGIALTRIGWPRVLGVAAAAAGLAATWLSGSRGAVLTAAIAVVVMLAVAARRHAPANATPVDDPVPTATRGPTSSPAPLRATAAVALVAAVLTVGAVLGLATMWNGASGTLDDAVAPGGISAQPVTAREQDATGNLRARFGHWEAAVRMFATSPLTGTGPGSYRWSSVPVYPEDTNLTASAHGEQVEALGELGIVGGGAAVALTLGLAWLVLGALRRPGAHHLEVAGVGTATLLAAHAALDFDWEYALLLALLAIAAATLHVARRDPGPDEHVEVSRPPAPSWSRPLTVAVTVASLLLVAAGAAGILAQVRGAAPWELDGRFAAAVSAGQTGDAPTVQDNLAALERWNPGAPRLDDVRALAQHSLGEISDEELAATIDAERSAFADQLQAAAQLLEADRADLAQPLLDDVQPVLDRRRAWGIDHRVVRVADLQLVLGWRAGGCAEVAARWPEVAGWLDVHDLDVANHLDAAEARFAERGTELDAPWWTCELTTPRGG